jgi:hypothetical protein
MRAIGSKVIAALEATENTFPTPADGEYMPFSGDPLAFDVALPVTASTTRVGLGRARQNMVQGKTTGFTYNWDADAYHHDPLLYSLFGVQANSIASTSITDAVVTTDTITSATNLIPTGIVPGDLVGLNGLTAGNGFARVVSTDGAGGSITVDTSFGTLSGTSPVEIYKPQNFYLDTCGQSFSLEDWNNYISRQVTGARATQLTITANPDDSPPVVAMSATCQALHYEETQSVTTDPRYFTGTTTPIVDAEVFGCKVVTPGTQGSYVGIERLVLAGDAVDTSAVVLTGASFTVSSPKVLTAGLSSDNTGEPYGMVEAERPSVELTCTLVATAGAYPYVTALLDRTPMDFGIVFSTGADKLCLYVESFHATAGVPSNQGGRGEIALTGTASDELASDFRPSFRMARIADFWNTVV